MPHDGLRTQDLSGAVGAPPGRRVGAGIGSSRPSALPLRQAAPVLWYWAAFLFSALVIASVLASVAVVLHEQAEAAAVKNSTNLLNVAEGRLVGTLARLQSIVDATAESVTPADLGPEVSAVRRAELNAQMRARLALFPEALQLSVIDASGYQLYAALGEGGGRLLHP